MAKKRDYKNEWAASQARMDLNDRFHWTMLSANKGGHTGQFSDSCPECQKFNKEPKLSISQFKKFFRK